MKSIVVLWLSICLLAGGAASAQEQAGPEVIASAVAAVRTLGAQVVQGNHGYAIERMYPRWKERMAKRVGGMDKLEGQLATAAVQMQKKGIHIVSIKEGGAPKAYEVWPGKKTKIVDGKSVEVMIKTKWLVLIPAVTKFRVIDELGKFRFIESRSFQAAISDKGKNDWFFMDGAGLTVNELRSLFPALSDNVELPKIERREVK